MNCPCVAAGAVTAPIATENYWQQTVWQTAGTAAAAPHLMYENIYLIAKLQNNGPFTVPIFTRFGAWQFFFYFFNYFQLWWEYSEIQPVHGSVIIVSNDMFTVILLFYSFDCICTMHASVSLVPYCWGHRWRHIAPQYHNNPHNARCTNLQPPPATCSIKWQITSTIPLFTFGNNMKTMAFHS